MEGSTMKITYIQPTMVVVKLQHQGIICTSGIVTRTAGNADLDYEGGGSGPARTKESSNVWDDTW